LLGLVGFGVVACFGGEAERGVRMLAALEGNVRQRGLDLSNLLGAGGPAFMMLRQARDTARAQLGPVAFESAWAAGQQLTSQQAIALATEIETADAPLPVAGRGPDTD
jgi:hypothetical protein